ncbi:MAG: chromosome segregation protein SMC [Pseudomonadota bacterium]
MHIKRLDIYGFKSFIEKTTLLFSPDINAIVGPNGCGKSNVIDAIQWAMGEQSSKQMRGKSREDMIFAGAEEQHPLNMAEVVMTLANSGGQWPEEYRDIPEISVGRRLFRSGASEYFINKRSCRLKDIHNIFLGTGAGTRAYSIIQQGRIGAIIEASPEEIRYFIEEAAGTTRYKNQKQESLKKVEKTKQNLLRVNDIIGEITRQKNALNRQAKKAEQYQKLQEEARQIDIAISVSRYRKLAESITEGDRLVSSLKDMDAGHTAKLTELDAAIEEIKWQRAQREQTLSQHENQHYEKMKEIGNAENTILFCQKEAERLISRTAQIEKEQVEILDKNQKLMQESSDLTQLVDELEKETQAKGVFLKEQEQEETLFKEKTADIKISAEKEKKTLIALLTREAQYKNAQQNANRHKNTLNQRINKVKEETEKAKLQAADLEHKVNHEKERLKYLSDELTDIRQTSDTLGVDLQGKRTQLRQQVKDVQTLTIELQEVRSRYNTLRKIDENYEWLKGGARAIMKRRQVNAGSNGICGLVADIIEPEPFFELAVEAALGESLQHVIVKTHDDGVKAIDYLAAEAGGRSSFIPMNEFRPYSDVLHATAPQGERLLNHVKIKTEHEGIAGHLLGHAIVVEKLEDALALWNKNSVFQTLVTKGGDRITFDGILTGGSPEKVEASILSKKREIKSLAKIVSELELRLDAAKAELKDYETDVCGLEVKQRELAEAVRIKEEVRLRTEKELYRTEEDLKHALRQHEIAQLEVRQMLGEEVDLDKEIGHHMELLQKIADGIASSNKQIALQDAELRKLSDGLSSLNNRLLDARLELGSLKAKKENASNDLKRLNSFRLEGSERITQIDSELKKAKNEIETTSAKEIKENERLQKLTVELKVAEQTLSEIQAEFQEIDLQLGNSDREITKVEGIQKETQQKIQRLELEQSERRLTKDHLCARLDERYHEDLKTLAETLDIQKADIAKKEEELSKLREKLAAMGEVNLTAIKEFETLNERLDFYTKQHQDLDQAMQNLQAVIRKINTTTKQKFIETFDAINEKLQAVFPTLFEGGNAKLELSEPEKPLESGVEFLIHPPGKKLLRMSLLSGGEKALAALAFMFSIYLIKPSPFCLLDEIDAPLDDVNVDRFTRLLSDIAEYSQVVLVTHNKRSMETSNTLFGITMEKKGVSKLVSVNLRELEVTQAAA